MTHPTRRSFLGSLGSGVAVVLAGCQGNLVYYNSLLTISRETEIRDDGGQWTIDGSVSMQFGHEFDVERIEGVSVEIYGAEPVSPAVEDEDEGSGVNETDTAEHSGDHEPLSVVEVGTMTDPDPDQAGSSTGISFEATIQEYPRRFTVELPQEERGRLCGSSGSGLDVDGFELVEDATVATTGRLEDIDGWDRFEQEC